MFDTLYDYCNEWKLEVNVQKIKIAAFRNGGKLRNTENWSMIIILILFMILII